MAELPPAWNWRGRGVSGLAPEDARILHAPGTQCARHNDCTKEFLFAALGRQRPAKKKPKKQFGMGAENVTGGALVQIENPDESSTSDQAFTLEQLQGRVWWQEQKCAAMPMRR